jgi:hypothetical protein
MTDILANQILDWHVAHTHICTYICKICNPYDKKDVYIYISKSVMST